MKNDIFMQKIIAIGEMRREKIFLRKNGIKNFLILLMLIIKTMKKIKMEEMSSYILMKKIIWLIIIIFLILEKYSDIKI